jgi:glycosyltransferase involved in cell wall biosynthesis
MNILILTHYYPPEIGAPQARLSEMARVWQQDGHEVTVLTCFPNHPTGIIPEAYRGKYFLEEVLDGVSVKRCWVYATRNVGFFKRILNHVSFMISSVIQGHRFAKGADIIVSSSPTFFSVISAFVLSKIYRAPYVFEVRDLWPAIFKELGVLTNPVILGFLERIEMGLYRHAALIVPVTDMFSQKLQDRGIPAGKLCVIKNGVNTALFVPRPVPEDLKTSLGLSGKFIVGYMGAHGISHALIKVIDAAERVAADARIHFLFVGEGAEKALLQDAVSTRGLTNVTFLPGQIKSDVPDYYALMDVSLVPLRDIGLFDSFIPSKMFEIMGMKRAIIGMVRGEAAAILEASGGALVGPPENVDVLVEHIRRLCESPVLCVSLGESGERFVKREFNREVIARRYASRMAQVVEMRA